MSPFWKHFAQDVGGYGKHGGTVFMITIAVGASSLVVVCILPALLGDYFPFALGLLVFIAVYYIARVVLRLRQKRGRYSIQPLSREEIRRARSKLIGNQQQRKL